MRRFFFGLVYVTVTELSLQDFFYNNQRGITQKQSFMYATHRLDLLLIPIKLHEDIQNGY